MNLKFFTNDEFERVASPLTKLRETSLQRLDRARELAGVPFIVNSAYRSPEEEVAKGRSGIGAHTRGCAFDIACTNSSSRWRIVFGALAAGFTRIGIGPTFVHMDDCEELPGPCIWLY